MVKLLMNAMGYSAMELKSSHSTADSAACTCSSSRHVCFTAENLAMAVF